MFGTTNTGNKFSDYKLKQKYLIAFDGMMNLKDYDAIRGKIKTNIYLDHFENMTYFSKNMENISVLNDQPVVAFS